MRRIAEFAGLELATLEKRPLHLAIGIFDGMHLGHRAVIEAAVQSAHRGDGQSAVLTFSPHPSMLLRPQQPTRMMMSGPAKARAMARLGVGTLVTQPFTAAFAEIAAEEFVPWLKQRVPQLVAIYVGQNWQFGRGRKGDVALLVTEGVKHGLSVYSAPRINLDGIAISSSRIRGALEQGDIADANAMFGYVYFSEGVVEPGKKLGRTLGFPTLNLAWSPEFRPRFGVYVVRVSGPKSATPLTAVANYGLRPTVENSTQPRLEVHVLGECPYDEGDALVVEWEHFLRPEMKFAGLGELSAQIARDREDASAYFNR